MIVMKFGGTSWNPLPPSNASPHRQSARRPPPVVVVSAMGKTTNKLLAIATARIGHRDRDIRDIHSRPARFPSARSGMERTALDEHFQELTELVKGLAVLGELTPRSIDAISSFGERLSSLIVTNYFQKHGISAVHVDSRKVIVTDKPSHPCQSACTRRPMRVSPRQFLRMPSIA